MPLLKLVHLGDLELTLPLAAAMSAWLMAARAWRTAFWWSFLFSIGIGLVGATKIAFLGWGAGLPALNFKAVSGHATGVTAVFPTLFYLLLHSRGASWRTVGAAAGLVLGAAVALLLVGTGEHTVAEALAGWGMGALVSLGSIRLSDELSTPRLLQGSACGVLVFLAASWAMQSAHVGYWMIKAALALSGNDRPFPWDSCG